MESKHTKKMLIELLLQSENFDLVEIYFCGVTPKDTKQYKYFIKFLNLLIKVDTCSLLTNTISKVNFKKIVRDYELYRVQDLQHFYANIYTTNILKKHSNCGELMTHDTYLEFLEMVRMQLMNTYSIEKT